MLLAAPPIDCFGQRDASPSANVIFICISVPDIHTPPVLFNTTLMFEGTVVDVNAKLPVLVAPL